jgi:hypothetical protein
VTLIPADAPAPLAVPSPPRRSKLPWIIGGIALGLIALIGAAVMFVVVPLLGATQGPQAVVGAYDRAFDEVDCELYLSITTPAYQESYLPDCEQFEAAAQSFVDSYSDYKVTITGTTVSGETATVGTTETYMLDDQPGADEYTYHLVKAEGSWLIDSIELG